jgi:hypothetical protein
MPPFVFYDRRIQWGSAGTHFANRPFCEITVHGPSGSAQDVWALMDTGADYFMLDRSVARILGIDLVGCPVENVTTATGSSYQGRRIDVDVTVVGRRLAVTTIFGPVGTPLFGRTAILGAADFGMDLRGWLYRTPDTQPANITVQLLRRWLWRGRWP